MFRSFFEEFGGVSVRFYRPNFPTSTLRLIPTQALFSTLPPQRMVRRLFSKYISVYSFSESVIFN